ncbi:hypothetical protein SK128_017274 [Halocaridina rubra]|uniref:Uncharacterized protein n=1 Tax=Halocaridina rubra TaxID=373956 RepID=A0AAN8X9P1_HALRR
MTHKSFLHEMRNQVHVDASSYSLIQSVWSGWMSFANDPAAMQKLEKIRSLKISGKVVKDVLSRFVRSCPKEHQKAISDWIKRGSLKKQRGGHFPNVTLACFSPLKRAHLDKYDDVNPKWSEETEWIKAVSSEDDMIYAPHGIDMIFQDWDFVLISRHTKRESNVLEMYLKFLTQVFNISSQKLLKSNQISINFVRANLKDVKRFPLPLQCKFDRIATGIHADLLGTPFVLQELGQYLRNDNSCARLITHHRVWSLCLNWESDLQAREMCQKRLKAGKALDPVMMISARFPIFRNFLQAELLHHLHKLDGREINIDNVMTFRDVSHAYDMILSDYSHHLNKIVPFRFRPEKRMVSMVDSRLHTLEWRRIARCRPTSAPPAAQTKSFPSTQNPDSDPASRYVDKLITISKNSPIPSSTNSDSQVSNWLRSREGSKSPNAQENFTTSNDRNSRSRTMIRSRPKSLYVSTKCKSPLLSSECDFWEQQNLINKQRIKPKPIICSEIPEGAKYRAQKSLEAGLSQTKVKPKSAPASPQSKSKSRNVKEKANAFERGTATRSTFPESRKHIDAITPSTPVKKLVMMFSKAFSAKDKYAEKISPLKRSNSLHECRLLSDLKHRNSAPKDFTKSLMRNISNKSSNVIESGVCTLPRKARPHSIAVSKFSYLEGCTEKRMDTNVNTTHKETEEKMELKKPAMLSPPDVQHERGRKSPIRSLIAGLNAISVSPVLPRAAKPQCKILLKDTISVKHDELKLVNLRPGSPRLPSPVSNSPSFDDIEAIDWPEYSLSKVAAKSSIDSPRKTLTNSPRRTPTDSPRISATNSPQMIRSMSSRRSSSPNTLPKIISSLKRSLKKMPNEPEYLAPPLHIVKSPTLNPNLYLSATHDKQLSNDHEANSNLLSADEYNHSKISKLEDIFSPKPSPCRSPVDLYHAQRVKTTSGIKVHSIQADLENIDLKEKDSNHEMSPTSRKLERKDKSHTCTENENELDNTVLRSKDILSTASLYDTENSYMSTSLAEADQEVSDFFSRETAFSPVMREESQECQFDAPAAKDDQESAPPENECAFSEVLDFTEISTGKEISQINVGDPEITNEIEDVQCITNLSEKQCEVHKPQETLNTSATSKINEQSPSSVYRMVEHFAQRIQTETERPASPKSVNVMNRKSWIMTKMDDSQKEKENDKTYIREKGYVPGIKEKNILENITLEIKHPTDNSELHLSSNKVDKEIQQNIIDENDPKPSTHIASNSRDARSHRSSPVKNIATPTAVTKMVEKFALEIEAQALPPSTQSTRPHSIGTLIQQDFLRLYSESPVVDVHSPDEDIQENMSLNSDCCEETMFDISDDEEQITGDIGVDTRKNTPSKDDQLSGCAGMNCNYYPAAQITSTTKMKTKILSASPNGLTGKKEEIDMLVTMKGNISADNSKSVTPRESKCDELRHEFLQKIRGISESPIPPSKKKYGDIKGTLSKVKKNILKSEEIFCDSIQNSRTSTSSPQLEDMAIVSYTIKIDTGSITDQLRTPPITPRDNKGSALCLVADKESHGLDGDSQELCSNEYIVNNMLQRSNRTSSPAPSPSGFHTFPKKNKGINAKMPNSSLQRPKGKIKVPDTDIDQHKVPVLKSSRTGGMDKMSFRNFVKRSIANEDLVTKQLDTHMSDNDTHIIEYTSSVEVSTDELESNSEYVEEAIEAISFTSEEDEPPVQNEKFTLHSDDTSDSENSDRESKNTKSKVPRQVKRKKLPRSCSPLDTEHHEGVKYYIPSPRKDGNDLEDEDTEHEMTPLKEQWTPRHCI